MVKRTKETIKSVLLSLNFLCLIEKKFTKISDDLKLRSDETQGNETVLTFLFCFLGVYNTDELYLLSKPNYV